MKKLVSVLLAAMMLLSFAAVAHADTGTIPLYADELNLPALKAIPTVYTEHKEDAYGRGSTTLWSSMVLDSATVMVYDSSVHYNVPVALDLVDGTSATYSTTGLKRQVGITYSGGTAWKTYDYTDFGYVNVGDYDSEDAMYGELYDEYINKGWDSSEIIIDPEYVDVSDVLNFYVNVEGKNKYVGYYDVMQQTTEEKKQTAENVIRYLVETEGYNPDALSFKEEVKTEATGWYSVYAKEDTGRLTYANWNGGDDAYYLTVGNQTSLHGRSGKVYQVSVAVDEDLFNTDMEFVSGTVTYKKNGNNGAWYPAKVTMNYSEASAVRSLTAEYLPTYDLGLQGYTVNIIDNGTSYVLNYNAWGGFESADAYNGAGSYHSTGARAFDWANKASWKYVRNFSLLSLNKLKGMFTRLY